MKVLIRQARIICSSSPFHKQVKDILIEDGTIEKISDVISENADEIIADDDLHISLGWMDVFAGFPDPGFEHKETIETGIAAAAAGGFTDVMVIPNTSPPVSSKAQVEYIIQRASGSAVNIYPIASVTKNTAGKELAEMYDMHSSGAIAFSDGTEPVQSPGIFSKALQYIIAVESTAIQVPDDRSISANGLMNEGIMSTKLGLPGKPAIAEELMIARDIELLKYTGSNLHITGVSTRKGIELIRAAKHEGLRLSCSVTPYHYFFCDEDLHSYDTNLKVNPPLRNREDMLAVREAVNNGEVDCIASHHIPQHIDDKNCEFEYAKEGMTGLESVYGVMNSMINNHEQLIEMLTAVPRKIFGISMPLIKKGEAACLTLFNPGQTYTFNESMIKSRSHNNAFIGRNLKGKVIGIINRNRIILNQQQ